MATKEFSIGKVVSHLKENPLLSGNKYKVILTDPFGMVDKPMMFNCHTASLPSHSIGTFEHAHNGPKRKIPNEEIFDDISLTFYLNKHIDEMMIIDNWLSIIGGTSKRKGQPSYTIEYYDNIIGQMDIEIYDNKGEYVRGMTFTEVYPTGKSDVDLSYNNEVPVDMTVTFAYREYTI